MVLKKKMGEKNFYHKRDKKRTNFVNITKDSLTFIVYMVKK